VVVVVVVGGSDVSPNGSSPRGWVSARALFVYDDAYDDDHDAVAVVETPLRIQRLERALAQRGLPAQLQPPLVVGA
jgi:hypothetical protein